MKKSKYLALLGTLSLLFSCGTPETGTPWVPPVCDETFTYASLANEERKDSYETYLGVMPTTLNYTKTMQAENAQHIANFVDGLVEHDRFGRLKPCLATDTGRANEDYTEWTFTLDSSKNATWVTAEGTEYAKVKPEDFRTILKVVLHATTASESAYLPLLIIDGAEEYVEATKLWFQTYKNDEGAIKYGRVAKDLTSILGHKPTNQEIDELVNGDHLGVVTTDTTITYKLTQSADYFPTMLTYLPFLPLNEDYYNANSVKFGAQKNILFNGAYLLNERTDTKISYTKNNTYWDADNVKTKTVIYQRLGDSLPKDFARSQYDAGKIDGYTLSSFDTEGWDKYVKGSDGKGTIVDPHHELTYSSESTNVDSSFMFYLNLNRPTNNPSGAAQIKDTAVLGNTNKALQYSYFRKAVYDALDLNIYNARNGQDLIEQQQTQINTYIPKNFVTDDNGKDYFEYLLDAYQEKHNVSRKEAEDALNPGQVVQKSQKDSAKQTKDALAKLATDAPTVTYPIKIEYASFFGDSEQKMFDYMFIEATNERLNGCIVDQNYYYPTEDNKGLPVCNRSKGDVKVEIVPNASIQSTQTYLMVSATYDYHLFISGWGPDYGDPMTYAHTVVQGGDLALHMGIPEKASHFSEETQALFDTYGKMVEDANAIVSTSGEQKSLRYKAFAEAEIFMLEELAVMRPLYQSGQGYSCSISNFIPFRSPRSGYGLSSSKLKGMEILKRALTGCERKALRKEWEAEKNAATEK